VLGYRGCNQNRQQPAEKVRSSHLGRLAPPHRHPNACHSGGECGEDNDEYRCAAEVAVAAVFVVVAAAILAIGLAAGANVR
jgi:hypothetical protein